MRIFKYTLEVIDTQIIKMPVDAILLTIQMQRGKPCLWALVDESLPSDKEYRIKTYGTGHKVPKAAGIYIGTYQLAEGALVFHVFSEYCP
jgi:hypothetical protein